MRLSTWPAHARNINITSIPMAMLPVAACSPLPPTACCHSPAGTRRNNNVFTTSTRRRRRRVDAVKTLSLRHYCVMCPLGGQRFLLILSPVFRLIGSLILAALNDTLPMTGGYPTQCASNADIVFMPWPHHDLPFVTLSRTTYACWHFTEFNKIQKTTPIQAHHFTESI